MARRGRSAGFFAVDRLAMREAMAELGDGEAFGFFLMLAADAIDGEVSAESIGDVADTIHISPKTFRRLMARLEVAGFVKWERAPNQHGAGAIHVLRDIESEHTSRRRREAP